MCVFEMFVSLSHTIINIVFGEKLRARLGTCKIGLSPTQYSNTDRSKAILLLWFLTVTGSCCPYLYFGSPIMWVTAYLGRWMITCLGKSCPFRLPRLPFVNCCQFMFLVISLLVLRAEYVIWLYQFLIIAYCFTLNSGNHFYDTFNVFGETLFTVRKLSQDKKVILISKPTCKWWQTSQGIASGVVGC